MLQNSVSSDSQGRLLSRTLFFFDPEVVKQIPPPERAGYQAAASQLNIAAGRPYFIGFDGLPDRELDGFCNYLISPGRVSKYTWASYATQVHVYLRFLDAQGIDWKIATRDDIIGYFQVRVTGSFQNTPKIKPQSWNIAKTAIVHLYEYGVEKGLIANTPILYRKSKAYFPKSQLTDDLGAKFTPEPINFISISLYKSSWRPLVVRGRNSQRNIALCDLLISVGLRISEALNLEIHQIPDPDNEAYAGRKSVSVFVRGKRNKVRKVRIPKQTLRKIRFYIEEERADVFSKRKKKNKNCRVFLSEEGSPLAVRTVEAYFARLSKLTGIRLTPHGCRHTFAVYQLEAMIKRMAINIKKLKETGMDAYYQILNDPLRQLQLLLGHANISTTYQYLDFLEESELLVEESLGDWTNWENGNG
jgi:integrase/recombinase XerC